MLNLALGSGRWGETVRDVDCVLSILGLIEIWLTAVAQNNVVGTIRNE